MKKMFSLQQGNELVFQNPSISLQQLRIRQDLLNHHDSSDPTSTHKNCSTRKRPRQLTTTENPPKKEESAIAVADGDNDHVHRHGYNNDKKRMTHREIEKQRRQDMAKLYSWLRSLLPLEFIKGKRSIPDHMQQAVNYIKHKEENIKHLGVKRDELKNTLNTSVFSGDKSNIFVGKSSNNRVPNRVSVSPCLGGLEIIINSGYIGFQPEFMISRMLGVIHQHGFNILSYTSTKVNERLLLTIQSEVSDLTSNRQSVLQQKLSEVVHA